MVRKEVDYKVKYIGETMDDIENGKIYQCIAEWYDESGKLHDFSVIDDSREDYLYFPEAFEVLQEGGRDFLGSLVRKVQWPGMHQIIFQRKYCLLAD